MKLPRETMIILCRQNINNKCNADIKKGADYKGNILPITDAWESKYLSIAKAYNDGKLNSIIIDTVDNEPFEITKDNIEDITNTIFPIKMGLILTAQAEKRALDGKTDNELEELLL